MTTPERFELIRMVLLDSYKKGGKVEIRLDGHTSLNGTNAVGKTSLLRLIPLFYGESPNKMVRGGGVKKSFIEHYLTNSTSYVIFEYSRRGALCMVALHASRNGDNVCYRFIDKPFDLARFTDEAGSLIDGPDLNRHITKRGEYCSEQISVLSDYRAIIQNTVRKKEYRHLAAQFSYVGASSSLPHIEKIVTAMFSRDASFLDIKRIIASSVMEESQSIRLVSNKAEMEAWLREHRAYKSAMAQASRMEGLGDAKIRHDIAAKQVRGLHAELLLLKREQEAGIRAADETMRKIDKDLTIHDETVRNRLEQIGTEIGTINGEIKGTSDQIAILERRHAQYEKEGIEALSNLVESIPQLESRLADLRHRQQTLLGKSVDVANRYAELKNQRTTEWNGFERGQNALKDPIRQQKESRIQDLSAAAGEERERIEARFNEALSRLEPARDTLNKEIGALGLAAASPQPHPQYIDARDRSQAALNEAVSKLRDAEKAYEEAERHHQVETQEFERIDRRIATLRAQLQEGEDRRTRLLSLSNAEPGTLLHFLREHRPAWVNDIALVVPESLLLRYDLAPSLTDGGDLYGVSIDLSVLDVPNVASEAALATQIEEANRTIERIKGDIKAHETELESQSDKLNATSDKTRSANLLRLEAEARVGSCNTALDSAQRALAADIHEAARKATRALAEKKTELAKNGEAITTLRDGLAEQKRAHGDALSKALKEESDLASAQISNIDKLIEAESRRYKSDLSALEEELRQALKEGGVDTETLQRLQRDIAAEDDTLSKANAGRTTVAEWRTWLADQWPRIQELRAELQRHRTEYARLANEELEVKSLRASRNKALIEQKDALQASKETLEERRRIITDRCAMLSVWPADPAEVESRAAPTKSLDDVVTELNGALQTITSERDRAAEEVELILRSMYALAGTSTFQFYDNKRIELGPDTTNNSFAWVKPLQEWYGAAHQDVQRLLLGQCRLFSQGIHEFHDRLTKFRNQVTSYSSDLGKAMNDSLQFRSINSVAVRLKASFDSIDVWEKVAALDLEYTAWAGIDTTELPPVSFVQAVGDVVTKLQGRHTLEVKPEDLIDIEVDIDEVGQPVKTARDEEQLKDISSNGLSYIILCIIYVGLIKKARKGESVSLVWALDELRDLDFGNVQLLLDLLARNHISLISAFPDADPDILAFFRNRYTIREGRRIATYELPQEMAHV